MANQVANPTKLASMIGEWFEEKRYCCVKLPDGWFGRPFDNLHELTLVSSTDELTVIVLDQFQLIVIVGQVTIDVAEGVLEVSGFQELIWRWTEYGTTKHHLARYSDGAIQFVAE